jgi:voltage-gated potassium channel
LRLGPRLFSLEGARYAALLALVTVFAGGPAYAALEEETDAWDGVWWAVTTMTTVGYGDQFPVTTEGRVLAIVVMLVGIGFVSMLIGAASERFIAADLATEADEAEHELDEATTKVLGELRAVRARLDALETTVPRTRPG